jgi:hypothetical protein
LLYGSQRAHTYYLRRAVADDVLRTGATNADARGPKVCRQLLLQRIVPRTKFVSLCNTETNRINSRLSKRHKLGVTTLMYWNRYPSNVQHEIFSAQKKAVHHTTHVCYKVGSCIGPSEPPEKDYQQHQHRASEQVGSHLRPVANVQRAPFPSGPKSIVMRAGHSDR